MQASHKTNKTTCSYCGVGCGLLVKADPLTNRLTVTGDPEHPANLGRLCSKGMNLHRVAMDTSDRLLYPEMRHSRGAPLQRVSWDQAMKRAAAVFSSIIETHGPDAVGFYVSGQLLTEEYYLINKLAKGFLGTANIDTNSRLCMSSAVAAYKQALGEDAVPISYEDIDHCETFFIAGANPAWCHPILFRRIEDRKAAFPNTKIIVADPRRTDSCEIADLHLQLKPGTDVTLYNAIARRLIETGRIDRDFIAAHTEGFENLKTRVFERTTAEAAAICELPEEQILKAASFLGEARSFLTLWAMGLNQSSIGVQKNLALINLNLITGQIGRPGAGPFSLTGQPNAMGGREVGGLANMLAAHRDLANPADRAEVAAHWKVPTDRIPRRPGLSAVEMFEALREDRLKAIWIVCTNPLVSMPDSNMIEAALSRGRFIIVQDISRNSETARFADLLLPAAGWLEKEGTMTNSDRRVSYLPRLRPAPGEALPDAEIFARFAGAMGYAKDFAYYDDARSGGSSAVYAEHCALTRGTNLDVAGLSYERLRRSTVQWPAPHEHHPGTPRLFADGRFYTENGRAKLFGCPDENTSESLGPDFPFILTTGRIRDQWHTMTRTGKVRRLGTHIKRPFLEIHPDDARVHGIAPEDLVEITGRRGALRLRAKLTDTIKRGVVFAPMHWGRISQSDQARANNITNPLFDPTSKEPDFKFSAVHIKKYAPPAPRRIVVIGAGAASFAFVEAHRRQNASDSITILSREAEAYYNRILLPEYIDGRRAFEDLRLAAADFSREYKVRIQTATGAKHIDREAGRVIAEDGGVFAYDILVLATGSRPRRHPHPDLAGPSESGAKAPVYTLRNRRDAERIRDRAGSAPLIIGGGLLGIELADALKNAAIQPTGSIAKFAARRPFDAGDDSRGPIREVTLVHRSAHLMSRQLDRVAARLLADSLRTRKGIALHLNDEVIGLYPEGRRETGSSNNAGAGDRWTAYLASGKRLSCTSVICALGTEPEIELARAAGLRTNFGVLVDASMRTSDARIYAIGEVIEFKHRTFGTTLAAGEQAQALAGVLAGDPTVYYRGSIDLNILKVDGLPIVSMGATEVESDQDEVLTVSDPARGIYKKFIIRDDRLAGCILVGETDQLPRLRGFHESQLELDQEREELLGKFGPAKSGARGPIVCSCNQVGETNLLEALAAGPEIRDADELCAATGAGSGCGSCKSEVRRLLQRATAGQSIPGEASAATARASAEATTPAGVLS
ncbi:MAG: molybdopterin-dependent oxidoreductase [Leptospirales bacterium]|jgi:ferredoxin-nitrate reductase